MNIQNSESGEYPKPQELIHRHADSIAVEAALESPESLGLAENDENGGDPYNSTGQYFAPKDRMVEE